MAGRKHYRSNRRGSSASRRYAGRSSNDKTLFFCLAGGVVFVFGLVIAVVVGTSGPDPSPQGSVADSGKAGRPVFRRLDPPDEAPVRKVSRSPKETVTEPEEEPIQPEPVDPVQEETPPPVPEPVVKPPVVTPAIKPVLKPAPQEGAPNKAFTMLVTGRLGGESLSSTDSHTWSKLANFLQNEAPDQHWLKFHDGKFKIIRKPGEKRGGDGKLPKGYPDSASRKNPEHRLVIHATATFDGNIEFQGLKTGSKYSCRLDCSIQKRKGRAFESINTFSVQEKLTPAVATTDAEGDPAQLRMVYYAALIKLCEELAGEAPFSP